MMRKLVIFIVFLLPVILMAGFDVNIEGGYVFCGYNDIQIPGDEGTEFSFCDDLNYQPQAYGRMHLGYTINKKHYVFATLAPFTVKAEGTLDKNLKFGDSPPFAAGEQLTSYYNFNSWRLTWRYTLIDNSRWKFALGFTAKIRDAYISVENATRKTEFSNVGFVPIIHFMADYQISDKLGMNITGDALGAPQGRAEDVRFSTYYHLNKKVKLDLGYRILEGGADNDKIYGFALFHYLSMGLSYQF
ncbi:MAG: hypothetical protein K9M99_08390 [Candidatus Cloacimonetes bacterium]|nr:hypothetical protein [Candidatus Cloacimonadota bacterium]